jgi:hypothetical protein
MLLYSMKQKLRDARMRIKRYFERVSLEMHQEALSTIDDMSETIKELERKNDLLERQVLALEKDIDFREVEKKIDQALIIDLMAKILKYTDVPAKELKKLEAEVTELKRKAIFNYGR